MASRRTSRALSIERAEIEKVKKDLQDQQRILEDDLFQRVREQLLGKVGRRRPEQAQERHEDRCGLP